MPNSVVLTNHQDRRERQPDKNPVWEYVFTFQIITGGGNAEQTIECPVNGILQEATIEVGAAAGITGTIDVDFDDNRDVEFSANAALAESSTTFLSFTKPVDTFNIRADSSDDPTSGVWDIVVTCRGI